MNLCMPTWKWRQKAMSKNKNAISSNKIDIKGLLFRYSMIILGCVLIAFGSAVFLVPCNIIAGSLSGIGIIIDHFVKMSYPDLDTTVDITVGVLTWILFFIGLIFLGKKFTLRTLLATIIYPLIFAAFSRFHWFDFIINPLIVPDPDTNTIETANLLLAGLFGGAFIGGGAALTFIGGGSSGGIDIVYFIVEKYLGIKQSITSFVLDAVIIIVGMIVLDDIVPSLIGILSAFTAAVMIQFIFIETNTYYVVEIISSKWNEISRYVQDDMGRGVTFIDARGGYKNDARTIIRVACSKSQIIGLKDFIAQIDSRAFVTITQSKAIIGEGFDPHKSSSKKKDKSEK